MGGEAAISFPIGPGRTGSLRGTRSTERFLDAGSNVAPRYPASSQHQ